MALQPVRAAQYIRMSTDHQRYSPGHQAAAIETYALAQGYELIVTYADLGISGLKFSSRPGLQGLIADVAGGRAPYSKVLVYDVSRWGRFQDPDQSAHYEFLCREAGIGVEYCAEVFENDGSTSSTILKLLKRVMAAEYSRELSAKVLRAQLRMAAMGFRMGGPPGYGLRRLIVDGDKKAVKVLRPGEWNALRSNRVLLVLGPAKEVATVRRIYDLCLNSRLGVTSIVRLLNRERVPYLSGRKWTISGVSRVLTEEKYAGVLLFNRTTQRLGSPRTQNPKSEWVRIENGLPAIISRDAFDRVQVQFERRKFLSNAQMIDRLRDLQAEGGVITERRINANPDMPNASAYRRRFGGMENVLALVGQTPTKRQRTYIPDEELLDDLRRILAEHGELRYDLVLQSPWAKRPTTYQEHFGSLRRAFALIGYTPARRQRASMSSDEMLRGLAGLYAEHGTLSTKLVNATAALPTSATYLKRFGSFHAACALVGAPVRRSTTKKMRDAPTPRSTE